MASCIFQVIGHLLMLILLLFSCCGHSQEPVLDCIPSLRVPRNTVWKSPEKETLKINCTVTTESHCWKNVSVSWCKIEDTDHCRPLNHSNHTGTGWRNITEKERKFFLIFWSLSLQDAGLYRCKSDGPVFTTSHVINVTVTVVSNEKKTTVNLDSEVLSKKNQTGIRDMEQSVVEPFYLVCSIVIVVALVLTIIILFKTIKNKDSEPSLEDKDLLTTVSYGAAKDSSLQD
ncbi:uncharacterized protein LOC108437781 [Pygocentrus nattereri]|uniref:uncharacterized protein LOC108437781 n=1 Tax=Pygocentrus nattereri TaxID=42514 RepID=UPI0008148E78|nr:uncharacterized protein LOC108437781 [Pygocentrus nattereri]